MSSSSAENQSYKVKFIGYGYQPLPSSNKGLTAWLGFMNLFQGLPTKFARNGF
jgi:hypothetical protein